MAIPAKRLIPFPFRRWLRRFHQRRALARGLRAIQALPAAEPIPRRALEEVVYGWDNAGWSAMPEFVAFAMELARRADAPVLECGSGLSTLLLGAAAAQRGLRVWSLEHSPAWAQRVRTVLARHGIANVELCVAPLRDYGSYTWYDPPLARMPTGFALVVCDGPPGDTPGGRYGLAPVMRGHLGRNCTILLDDIERPEERRILDRWREELGGVSGTKGAQKPFGLLYLGKEPAPVARTS